MDKTTHIAVVPSPGFTHLVPILEFSKQLVHLHPHLHVTCIIPSLGSPPPASKAYLQTLPFTVHSVFLPPVPRENVPREINLAVQIQLTVTHSLPSIHHELKSLCSKNGLVALVVDIFAIEALDFAAEFNLLSYIYLPQAAIMFSLYYFSLTLDHTLSELRDPHKLIEIPGFVPVHRRDLPAIFQDRSSLAYELYLERARTFRLADGVLVNSFPELETETIRAIRQEIQGKKKKKKQPQIYMVGPIIQSGSSSETKGSDSDYCLKWLNNQSPRSVLYVSFGSGGTLSQEQLNELASGLELSGKKFLWVVRAPSKFSSAAYFSALNENPLDFLPEGFLERTKEQGLVVPSWAPQIPILSHSSVGGFLSHCGWNSTLESIVHGVPLITWPLFAEQKINTVLLTRVLKVGVRPKMNENGIVEREEVAEAVKSLMEGEESKEINRRMKGLKDAAANAEKDDGSSTKSLSQFVVSLKAE